MTKFEEYYRFISDNLPKEDRDLFNSIGSANRHAARMQLLGWSDNFDNVKAIAHAIGNVETQNMIIKTIAAIPLALAMGMYRRFVLKQKRLY